MMKTLGIKKGKEKKHGCLQELSKNKGLYLLTIPGIIYFLIFSYLPLVGIYYAFVDYKPMAGWFGLKSKFVGLENFKYFFASGKRVEISITVLRVP